MSAPSPVARGLGAPAAGRQRGQRPREAALGAAAGGPPALPGRAARRPALLLLHLALAAGAILASISVHAVEEGPVRLVPADDTPLASMLLLTSSAASPVLLFDAQDADALRRFVAEARRPVQCIVRAGTTALPRAPLEALAGGPCRRVDNLLALARELWPHPRIAVLAPLSSYDWLLRGAALAGAAGAALLPASGDAAPLLADLSAWQLDAVYVLPGAANPKLSPTHVIHFKTPDGIERVTLRRLGQPPATVVVANPKDRQGLFSPASLSLLAPLIAATHRAPLVLVDDASANAVEATVRQFITANALAPTHIFLVGDELALRSHRVPDPVVEAGGPAPIGGARDVRVELFSGIQHGQPQAYAVGRFAAENDALGSLTVARQMGVGTAAPAPVVLLSNAQKKFELGETIARMTVEELRNAGLSVQAAYRDEVTPAAIAQGLAQAGVLVWEGHAQDLTLEERGELALGQTPPLVVLQGCYTLDRSDPFILLEHGTQAIVASSAAIYSASGTAFAGALFDSLVYDRADLGTAVRDARNFLLALTDLKKQRHHADWTKTYRAALAFALWGDPTAVPALDTTAPVLPPARWRSEDGRLALAIPPQRLPRTSVGDYVAEPVPRGILSGLVVRSETAPHQRIKELFYRALPVAPGIGAACPPGPDWEVVSLHAPATNTLSVLARPPTDPSTGGAPAGEFVLPLVPDASRCASGVPPATATAARRGR